MDSGDTGRAGAGCALIICQYVGKCGFFLCPTNHLHTNAVKKKKGSALQLEKKKIHTNSDLNAWDRVVYFLLHGLRIAGAR